MDKELAVFEEFKPLERVDNSTALKTVNNYTIIITSNSDKIRIS